MNMNFNELEWHDAELLDIYIDRSMAGNNDIVKLTIKQPNDIKVIAVFTDCYALNLNMNFGMIVLESILDANILTESKELSKIRNVWGKMGVNLEKLKCFEIETNSTNSLIQIFALNYEIVKIK